MMNERMDDWCCALDVANHRNRITRTGVHALIEGRLEIGTKIYYVEEDNNSFRRKKIVMTDENGVEWYRHDQPLRTQNMIEHTILGRVLKEVEGRVPSVEDHIDEYFLEDGIMIDCGNINESDAWSGYFLDKADAEAWIEERKAEMHHIEHG
jgi:hypothetical protein